LNLLTVNWILNKITSIVSVNEEIISYVYNSDLAIVHRLSLSKVNKLLLFVIISDQCAILAADNDYVTILIYKVVIKAKEVNILYVLRHVRVGEVEIVVYGVESPDCQCAIISDRRELKNAF